MDVEVSSEESSHIVMSSEDTKIEASNLSETAAGSSFLPIADFNDIKTESVSTPMGPAAPAIFSADVNLDVSTENILCTGSTEISIGQVQEPVPNLVQIAVKRHRRRDWKFLVGTKHMLRPRKSETDAKPKDPLPRKIKNPAAKALANYNMLPPELPMGAIPLGNGVVAEMPHMHSENSSTGSEPRSDAPSSLKRRRRKRLTIKKKRRVSQPQNETSKERTVPSPSVAECNVDPACPESSVTAIEATKTPQCLCGKNPQVFVSSSSNPGDLTCQALDSIDDQVIGCCNPLPSATVGLHRPSSRTPYIMLCSVHLERLIRHTCCPGCGLFCSKGKIFSCRDNHLYHPGCSRQEGCLHCGDLTPPKSSTISIRSRRSPVFLPKAKPIRTTKSTKISVKRPLKDEALPVTLTQEVVEWTPLPAPSGDSHDSDKLANVLGVACRVLTTATRIVSPIPGNNRYTAKHLLAAVRSKDSVKLLKIMSSGLNPCFVFNDMKNQTVLHVASSMGDTLIVHLLIHAGIPVDLLDSDQNSPLSLSILNNCNDVTNYLVKAGASLITKDIEGMTPLHLAAKIGNVEGCSILLRAPNPPQKYVDILDDGGWTPMVWAAEYNHLEVVRFLISKGGDPLLRDTEQNIALHWAAYGGCVDIVELLLANGCNISTVNVTGDSPLHVASRQGQYNCVLLLLARGANCDIRNKQLQTAKDCAPEGSSIALSIALNEKLNAMIGQFRTPGPRILNSDISRGRERNPVQCVNEVDDAPEPTDYRYITENCITSRITIDRSITIMQSCTCENICQSESCTCTSASVHGWYGSSGKLVPEYNFADPLMLFECNQLCQCSRILCENRVVQNGVTCRLELFRTTSRGWGLKTLNFIAKGTFVCEYIGEVITDKVAEKREDTYLFDFYNRDDEMYCIDARNYGNIARFINHLCENNLTPVHVFVEHQDLRFPRIALFANTDIQPNTELGYNYGEKWWMIKSKAFTCSCGSEKCKFSSTSIQNTLELYRNRNK